MHPSYVHSQSPHILPNPVASPQWKKKQNKVSKEGNKSKNNNNPPINQTEQNPDQEQKNLCFFFSPASPSPLHPYSWHWRFGVPYTISFCPISLTGHVHCNESSVWFKVSGFWYPILTGSLWDLPWGVLYLWELAGIAQQDQFFHKLQQDLDGVDIRVGKPKAQL